MKKDKKNNKIPPLEDMRYYEIRRQWAAMPMIAWGISREEAYKIIDEEMARYLKEQRKIN